MLDLMQLRRIKLFISIINTVIGLNASSFGLWCTITILLLITLSPNISDNLSGSEHRPFLWECGISRGQS
jgi:hypothetical protein